MGTVDEQQVTQPSHGTKITTAAPRRGRRQWGRKLSEALSPIAFLTALIVAWEIYVRATDVAPFLLPAPTAIWDELVRTWSIALAGHTWVTFQEAIAGFVLGVLLGFILAVGIAYSKFLERTLYPLIVASQAVPKIAIAPLFVVWLGFGLAPKILVTILLVFFPIVVTTTQGLMSVDPNLLQLLRSVSASQWQVFRKVRLPHALPYLVSGMKIGITLAVIGAVVGEWVGADEGLGYQIIYAQSQLQTPRTFAAIAILVLMSVVLFLLVSVIGRLLTPWTQEDETRMTAGL